MHTYQPGNEMTQRFKAILIAGLTTSSSLTLISLQASAASIDTPNNEMVTVSAGNFDMGCNSAIDPLCTIIDEEQLHRVYVDEFQIDKYEVTFQRYQKCISAGECTPLAIGGSMNYDRFLSGEGMENFPVNGVSWFQADMFCKWEDKRLPTEAEWEKAARGPDGRIFPWGNEYPTCDVAVMDAPLAGELGCKTGNAMNVGSKPKGASPYGAEDMAGNVWEWVSDWYSATYFENSPKDNPQGPETGSYKVAKGGDFFSRAGYELRGSSRFFYDPSNYSPAIGFRCAK